MEPVQNSWPLKVVLLTLLAMPSVSGLQSQEENESARQKEEAEDYFRKWLNEDVVYVITPDERSVFEKLTTPEEKDHFIEQFWQLRDPDPTTAANEFREEHYRRIAYANSEFQSGMPGWKTDRGRVYIMFGPADETEYHAGGGMYVRPSYEGGGRTSTYPFVVWRYRSLPGIGDDIEMEFVDRSMSGEFKMAVFPWEKDALLHVDGMGDTLAERLGMTPRNYRPGLHPGNLNNQSYMSKYMGTRFKDRPFERYRQFFLLQRAPEIKQKELQAVVETNVSYVQLPFASIIHQFRIDDSAALVPLTLEVPNSGLQYVDTRSSHKARVGIYGRVTSMLGQVVAEFEDSVASEYTSAQLEAGLKQKSLYQRTFLLEAGHYKVEVVIKDMNSGNVGTFTGRVHIATLGDAKLAASPIVLARKLEQLPDFVEKHQSFVIGDLRVVPNVRRAFKKSDDMGIYLQVYNARLDEASLQPSVTVRYTVSQGKEIITEITDTGGASVQYASDDRVVLIRRLRLAGLSEGHYRLTVTVSDAISGQSSDSEAEFDLVEDSRS